MIEREVETPAAGHRPALVRAKRMQAQIVADFGRVPVRLIQTLMIVGLQEGLSMTEIAQKVGAKPTTTSRDLLSLGKESRYGGAGRIYCLRWLRCHLPRNCRQPVRLQ